MTKQFSPEQIRSAAKDLQRATDELDGELDAFLHEIKEIGPAFGSAEMIGQLLGESYGGAEETLVRALESVIEGFDGFVERLNLMADNDERGEQAATDIIEATEV